MIDHPDLWLSVLMEEFCLPSMLAGSALLLPLVIGSFELESYRPLQTLAQFSNRGEAAPDRHIFRWSGLTEATGYHLEVMQDFLHKPDVGLERKMIVSSSYVASPYNEKVSDDYGRSVWNVAAQALKKIAGHGRWFVWGSGDPQNASVRGIWSRTKFDTIVVIVKKDHHAASAQISLFADHEPRHLPSDIFTLKAMQ